MPVIAMYSAMLVAAQLALSAVAGVELVTVLLAVFAAVFGPIAGIYVAVTFSFLRCLIFGFYPNVVVLYLAYYPLFAFVIAMVSRVKKWRIVWIVLTAVLMTACFTMIDNVISPLMLGFYKKATRLYFLSSLPTLGLHCTNALLTVSALFLPLEKVFIRIKKNINL